MQNLKRYKPVWKSEEWLPLLEWVGTDWNGAREKLPVLGMLFDMGAGYKGHPYQLSLWNSWYTHDLCTYLSRSLIYIHVYLISVHLISPPPSPLPLFPFLFLSPNPHPTANTHHQSSRTVQIISVKESCSLFLSSWMLAVWLWKLKILPKNLSLFSVLDWTSLPLGSDF